MTYEEFLDGFHLTETDVIELMQKLPDPIHPTNQLIYPIFSTIQGIGLASICSFIVGDHVTISLIDGVRQVGARYMNHSDDPNTKSEIIGKDIVAIATKPIKRGEELTCCYAANLRLSNEYTNG